MASHGEESAPLSHPEDIDSEDLHHAGLSGLESPSDIDAEDIESNIDRLFSVLLESASNGYVVEAALYAMKNVRSTWMFLQHHADEFTMTEFYVQLIDRILHNASIYGLERCNRRARAVRELVFHLHVGFSQNRSTPLKQAYLGISLVRLLRQLVSNMKARGNRQPHVHSGPRCVSCHPFLDDEMAENMSRYVNLCAFARDLVCHDIDGFGWMDIMTNAFKHARNNMPSRRPSRDNRCSGLDTWKAYLSGAEAWVDHRIIRKSLRSGRVSQASWRNWRHMFTEASYTLHRPGFEMLRNSFIQASGQILRASRDDHGYIEAGRIRRPETRWASKGRPLRIPVDLSPIIEES